MTETIRPDLLRTAAHTVAYNGDRMVHDYQRVGLRSEMDSGGDIATTAETEIVYGAFECGNLGVKAPGSRDAI